MSVYTPSFATIIPPNMYWSGDSYSEAAVAHPVLLTVPPRVETKSAPTGFYGEVGNFYSPPRVTMACQYAATWQLDCSLSGSGVTLTESATIISPVLTDGDQWTAAIRAGTRATYSTFAEGSGDPANSVALDIDIGWDHTALTAFSLSDGKFWPRILVAASTVDWDEPVESDTFIGVGDAKYNGAESPVILTIHGTVIPMRYEVDGPSLTGSITLTPASWLRVE